MDELRSWAWEEFGRADLGDRRRSRRLVRIVRRLAEGPYGAVSRVCEDLAERQAAYDFLSNEAIRSSAILGAATRATAQRCEGHKFVFVAIDGTSITLTDRAKSKPLGPIGARRFPTRGLKIVDAVAVASDGTPQGLVDLQFWARPRNPSRVSRFKRRQRRETEMRHWSDAVQGATATLAEHAPGVRPWFVMDREADEAALLNELTEAKALFSIRAAQNRRIEHRGRRKKLFSAVRASKLLGVRTIQLPRTPKRAARCAVLELRATRVMLMLPTYEGHNHRRAREVGVVEVREISNRRDRLRWVLLTSCPTSTFEEVERVLDSYAMRWRVEEFHRTWKRGGCNAEQIQLRSAEGIRKWAILLGAVAARAERIKHLSRTQPDAPATIELTEDEISALIVAKRRIKTSVEQVPDEIPTIQLATRWIADLGGFAGHYKGYQPGATTISRGLIKLAIWTDALRSFTDSTENKRKKR
jgi:Transposase DNA-binding/Transposase DDE domain